ncbi:MAG TPA: IclR family transcriptional regulator [Acidobacteriaceae bacterium]|nr:IclR family transcriptional regulator [Acidobacteriaceae bacterium]
MQLPRGDSEEKNSYATPALEKGLDVIELLAHQPGGLTKSEISRELKRTVSEIFRMLVCLERRGYIAQVDSDRYALTLKLFKLVQEHPPTERLITEALPVMHQLAHETQQSCHMGIIEGAQVNILAQVNAPTSIGFYVKLGSSVELMEASTGYVILAHQDDEHRARTLADWRRLTGEEIPADLHAHLARVKRQGFESRASYKVRGVTNISYPIFDERGSAIGALTVPYIQLIDGVADASQVSASLKKASRKITAAIGGRAPAKRQPHAQSTERITQETKIPRR